MQIMRHDQTNWLTHFVRDRNPAQDFPGDDEFDYERYVGGELPADASAFEVLKAIIRLGGITPGHSFRKGRTTIYGGKPAICATEMPLYSFANYALDRKDASKVSAYGISFLKHEFFSAGGRHVIYGLSNPNPTYKTNTNTCRIFDEDTLPLQEQYRYVAYNPSSTSTWIDWSHEREWRWIVENEELDEIWVQNHFGQYGPVPALPLFKGKLDGRPFTRVCIIVWNHAEADEIQKLLTGLYLSGSNNYDTPFDKNLIEASHIIVLEDVMKAVEEGKHLSSQTIEGLEAANLLEPIKIAKPPKNAKAIVENAMKLAAAAAQSASDEFVKKWGHGSGSCGFAHAVTYEVTEPIVQYLLAQNLAKGPFDGAIWIDFPDTTIKSQSMDYNEAVTKAAAAALSKGLGVPVSMESRLD